METDGRRGDWIDPSSRQLTVGQCWDRWAGARRLERASRLRDESQWRCHVAPQWAAVPVGSILQPDVSAWVVRMEAAGVGAWTIGGALGVLRALLDQAVQAKCLRDNPARGVKPPRAPVSLARILDPSEDELLLSALDRAAVGHPAGRLFGELLLYCGLRWEEAAALDRDHVDTRRALLHIGPVVERDGTIREYPKSEAGVRPVPVDRDLWPRLREHVMTTAPGGLLFTRAGQPAGRTLDYPLWREGLWQLAVHGRRGGGRGRSARPALLGAQLDDPQPTAHDMRHTYGTRLGEQNVPAHEIMRLMGHGSLAAVQRYLQAGEGRYDRARDAIERARSAGGS